MDALSQLLEAVRCETRVRSYIQCLKPCVLLHRTGTMVQNVRQKTDSRSVRADQRDTKLDLCDSTGVTFRQVPLL